MEESFCSDQSFPESVKVLLHSSSSPTFRSSVKGQESFKGCIGFLFRIYRVPRECKIPLNKEFTLNYRG